MSAADSTAASRLHAAAIRLRALAGAASEWHADLAPGDSLHLWVVDPDPSDPTGQTPMQRLVGGADAPWADFIAALAPPVALAVADWLEQAARDAWAHGTPCYAADHTPCLNCDDDLAAPHVRAALAVADAINDQEDQ